MLFIVQLVVAILAAVFVVVFVDRVFVKIYKLTEQHSLTDALTSLHNRRYLESIIENGLLQKGQGSPSLVSAILLDIDNFKQYNDQNGHIAGDYLLRDLAAVEARQFTLPDGCPSRRVTVSVGVSVMPEDADQVEQLIKTADDLLYRAKREGKNRVSVTGGKGATIP